eukprot:6919394-Alexandrium_andersonii.AAC.1
MVVVPIKKRCWRCCRRAFHAIAGHARPHASAISTSTAGSGRQLSLIKYPNGSKPDRTRSFGTSARLVGLE